MDTKGQLKLLLWKDFLIRRRHLGVAALVFGWAIGVFLILYIVRESVDPEFSQTCTYAARALPSTGLFPFVQSFLCNVDNKCNNLSVYEEVPAYKNARLTEVAGQLQTTFTNDTILKVVKSLPDMIELLKVVGLGLDTPDLEGIFGSGIMISNLFVNSDLVKKQLHENNPKLDVEILDDVFGSSIKLGHIFQQMSNTDLGSSICDPQKLEKFLILPENADIEKIADNLCRIDGNDVPNLIQTIFDNVDFSGLLNAVGDVVDQFSNYDMFHDIRKMVEVVLDLNFVKDNVPKNLRLKSWLPNIISEMKNMNRTHLDYEYIQKALKIIEPYFIDEKLWPKYKNLIINSMNLLVNLENKIISKGIVKYETKSGPSNFSEFVTNLRTDIEKLRNPTKADIQKQEEDLFQIANDFIVAMPAFYSNNSKPWTYIANMLDSLKSIIGNNKIFNRLSIIANIYSKSITGLHNTLRGEYESEKIMYGLCEKHSNTVSTLFSLGPEFITSMLKCFSNISCTSVIVENRNNISEIFCNKSRTEKFIPEAASIKNIGILCNIELNSFLEDLNKDFKLDWIDKIFLDFKKIESSVEIGDSESSFLEAVEHTENFIKYLGTRKNITEEISHINWEQIFPDIENTDLKNIIRQARKNSGLYMLNVQLSYVKSYAENMTELHPIFNASSVIIEGLLTQYNLIPKPLLSTVINNLPSILENILKIFTNKTQMLSLISIDDWEQNFCNNSIKSDKNVEFTKLICETIRFVNLQGKLPWYEQPILSAVYSTIKNFTKIRELNWDIFTENAQKIYQTVSDILNINYPKYNWDSEVFKTEFWMKWIKSFDTESEIHFALQIITKISDFIESNNLDKKTEAKWDEIKSTTNVANNVITFYLDIIDFSLELDNNTERMYPLTFQLTKNITQNMKQFNEDLEMVINLNDFQIEELVDWLLNPCNQIIKENFLNLSKNSINVLLALQDYDCNNAKYVKEWNLFVNSTIQEQNNTSLRTKNLQQTITKLSQLIYDLKSMKMTNNSIKEIKEIDFIHDGIQLEKFIFKVADIYLQRKVMPQETLNQMWMNLIQCRKDRKECSEIELDTARYTTKFIAAGIHEVSNRINDYINLINATEGVDPLRLIGFFNTSAVYQLYLKFPDYIKVFITTYRSTDFERKIFEKRSKNMDFRCGDVMDNLIIPENNSVTLEDIAALKKYLCPTIFEWPVLHDNIFLETVNKLQDMFLETPVVRLNISFVRMAQNLFDLKIKILDMVKYSKVDVNQLWNKIWTKDMEALFYETKKMDFNSNNTISRFFKYIEIPKDKFNISANLINPKYGFGDFTFLLQQINYGLNNFTVNASSPENTKQIKNLLDVYTKEYASFFSYLFIRYGEDFKKQFDYFCNSSNALEKVGVFMPEWITEDDGKILERLCNLSDRNIRNSLVPKNVSEIKNYNLVLEDIIIQFLSTLINFSKNKTDIDLSTIIKNNFDVKQILDKRFPSEEELRNSSLQKAHQLTTHRRSSIIDLYETLDISTTLVKILKGGDWWSTLMDSIKDPTIKIWLRILENAPQIVLHLSDAVISPHLLSDITSMVVTKGPLGLCQQDFELERYVHDDNIISIISEVCRKPGIAGSPLKEIFVYESNGTHSSYVLKEEKFAEKITNFEQSLIDLIKDGPKKFDLPKWMNQTEILNSYTDYAKHNRNPLRLLQTVTTVLNEVIDIGSVFYKNETQNCSWCTIGTILVREFSHHLSKAQEYTEFLCNAPKMNFTEIKRTLIEEFKWGNFFQDMVKNVSYSVNDFDRKIHDVVETIRVQLITFYTNKTLQALPEKCFKNIADTPSLRNISTYITAMKEMAKTLKSSSIQFLNSSLFDISSQNFTSLIEDYIPILKSPENIFNSDFSERLENMNVDNVTVNEIMNSKIDANMLSKIESGHELEMNIIDKFLFQKLFTFQNLSLVKKVYLDLNSENVSLLSEVIFASIDKADLNKKMVIWKKEAMQSLDWVAKIFENLEEVISNGGNLLEFISNIDFSSLSSGNINISGMLKGVLDLLEKNSIDKLFDSLRELVKSTSPFIRSEKIENDLYKILDGVENLDIFKNLGLLRIQYKISDLVKNWPEAKPYFVKQIHLEEDVVDDLLNSSIDLSAILSSQDDGLNIRQMICDPKELSKLVYFNGENSDVVAERVSTKICSLTFSELQNIATYAFKNINLTQILSTIMNTTVNTILHSAHMTEEEGRLVVKNIGLGAELLPELKEMFANISENMKMLPSFDHFKSDINTSTAAVLSPDLLASSSKLLCGRPLIQNSNKLYRVISEAKDFNADQYEIVEQKTLPSDFCRNLYQDIVNMEAGKVIWAYIKPLLRGQILYTPNIPAVKNILEQANTTFQSIAELQDILNRMTGALTSLENKDELDHILDNIQKLLNSSIVQMAVENVIKSITPAKIDLSSLNFKEMLNQFGDTNKINSALNYGVDFLNCVLLNRFVGVDTEKELEEKAKELMETNEFIAGIVFLNINNRRRRSLDIPKDVSYKIRMDIDSVPSTSYMKYKFWTPGPENDFLDELRYFRGFIQLQDLIDNAIIKVKTEGLKEIPKWDTLTQEVPYPCWTRDFFKSALAISQTYQVSFFFGLIAIVAAAVRYIVWEKESGNTMVMNVMGLKYVTHCISWFIVTLVEISFAMICIFIIVKVGRILPSTDGVLLFLYLIEYGFSIIMFCFMISSMFNSASLAAVGSAIFYLLSFMPFIIIISLETSLPIWAKMLTNLSMSTTFSYGCLYLIRYELQGVGLQWSNSWDTPIPGDQMSFGMTCIFLLFDGILYGIIGYLFSRKSQGENYLDDTLSNTNIINDEPLKIGVTIKALTKIYNSRKKTVKAIEDIDITLYTGQVTTLLGHNGAGKTTLIKILTGMMQPTSGQIIINSEITENGARASRFLGVCPQGSVLINTMSAVEHLVFYAMLKTAKSRYEVMPEVMDIIDSLSLGHLSDEPVAYLSEGMRRRLCVAIAFIGKPKLVVLDEPSSGVDPVARRQIWDLVIKYKEGCTVLLTTHYLDEAELLSDRVVVLHKGNVLCSGSPLILRQSYGSGYKITVTYPIEKEKQEFNNNTEMLLPIIKSIAANVTVSAERHNEVDFTVPFNSTQGVPNNFEAVANILEENQSNLGFEHFSMNCATLEQVFMDLCAKADAKLLDEDKADTISQIGKSYSNIFSSSVEEIPPMKDEEFLLNTGGKLTGRTLDKFFVLLKKRAIHYLYDWRVIFCALLLPTLFTAIAMGFSLIRPPHSNEPNLKLSPELYDTHSTSFISVDTNDMTSFINDVSRQIVTLYPPKSLDVYSKTPRDCSCENGMQKCMKSSESPQDSLLKLSDVHESMDWLIETHDEYIEKRYGGWSLSDKYPNKSAMIVWYNNKGYHSMPSYLNTMNSAILRTLSPGSSITTYSHPLKLSVDQLSKSSIVQHIADVGIAMVLLVAFSLVPASGSMYLVQERVNEEKRLQFLCGVSPTLYWVVAFVWDIFVLLCSLTLAVIVFKIFGLPVYNARENLAAVSLLIFLYGWACIPFIHLVQRFFKDASMANMILFCVCTFIGISELTCLLLMDILGKTQFVADFRQVLHKIYLIFPQFVLGDGLVEISKNNIQAEILERFHMDTYVSPLSWDLMGLHYLSLTLVGIILFAINLIIENEWFLTSKKSKTVYPSDTSCLEIVNLTKVYKTNSGTHTAVNNISLKVPLGQCLGLIGVNGAGKSTTFKMLTTELRPSSGRIFLQGREICRKPLCTGEMGYCPQCDSLDPKLTVRETLKLYLTLRGIDNQNEVLNKMMAKFELTNYANRKTENLSGGNRRKLCTALSVLGKTSLILMDEPTSGMDPHSRNLVGHTIQQLIQRNRSVILTSHSVEDCEALCSNIAVMFNGKILVQGTPQYLKEKYGSGYIISIKLSKSSEQEYLLELMKKHFPGCELMSRQYCSSQFAVPTNKTKLSEMFNKMTKISEYVSVEDYNLVQSSLDQVFINLANKTETQNGFGEQITIPNMYSMDVI